MRTKISSVMLSCGLAFCSSCEQKPTTLVDNFSGKTVADSEQAADVILARTHNAPVVGEMARNGSVYEPNKQEKIELKSLWKSLPTVLIFGSGSCTSTNLHNEGLNELARQYEGEVNFHFIYIREAHPEGGFQPIIQGELAKEKIPSIKDAHDLASRCSSARDFQERKDYRFTFLVDDIEDPIAASWGAWPTRIFVINKGGKVIYAGDQGPWYFSVKRSNWHDSPPPFFEAEFKKKPYSRISLEEFLETNFGATT